MGERLTAVPFLEERIDPDGHEYAEVRQEVDEDGRGKTEVEHYPEHVHPEEPREGEPKETLIRVAIAELTVGRNDRRTNDPSIAVHQDVLKVVQREEVGERQHDADIEVADDLDAGQIPQEPIYERHQDHRAEKAEPAEENFLHEACPCGDREAHLEDVSQRVLVAVVLAEQRPRVETDHKQIERPRAPDRLQ